MGYHIYRSYQLFGKYEHVTSNLITDLTCTDIEITAVVRYFIIKAIKLQTTGSGTYLNSSISVALNQNLAANDFEITNFEIAPNPANDFVKVVSNEKIESFEILNLQGK